MSHPFSQAVRADFLSSLIRGVDAQMAVVQMRKEYGNCLDDHPTRRRFVLSLALAAWQTGRLYPRLLGEAASVIEADIERASSSSDQDRRFRATLLRIEEIIRTPQPSQVDLTGTSVHAILDERLEQLLLDRSAA